MINFTRFICESSNKTKFFINVPKLIRSIFLYNKIIIEYRNTGFGSAADMIKRECTNQKKRLRINSSKYSYGDFQKIVSTLIPMYRIFGQLAKQSNLCLERSIALTYALISMGIPANLVIGKAKYYISDCFSFHAWVELEGKPLNDHDGMYKQWNIIYRLPKPISALNN